MLGTNTQQQGSDTNQNSHQYSINTHTKITCTTHKHLILPTPCQLHHSNINYPHHTHNTYNPHTMGNPPHHTDLFLYTIYSPLTPTHYHYLHHGHLQSPTHNNPQTPHTLRTPTETHNLQFHITSNSLTLNTLHTCKPSTPTHTA